eukprot:scaffold1036_cov135-Skeletonema_dohrnii-CCMP3373.AAC.1
MIAKNTAAITTLLNLLLLTKPAASSGGVDSIQHRSFSDQLTSQIYSNPNEFSSALGVSMAFSLVYPGSTNDAVDEISTVFGYLNDDNNDNMQLVWEDVSTSLTTRADGACVDGDEERCYGGIKPLLSIANSIWIDDGDALNADYEAVVGKYSQQIDFQSTDSPTVVNQWVNNQTNGLVDSIVQEGEPLPGVLVAINSIYLKASWAKQFYESNTNLDVFYSSPLRSNEVAKAHFMHQVGEMLYSHDVLPGYQIVQLPFASSSMSMVFVLPTSADNDDKALIPSSQLVPALNSLKETRVALALPKFKFESMYDDNLKEALQDIGIVSPFEAGTQSLCNIFAAETYPCDQLFISRVLQKTVVDVNEEGVEAAAVTALFISKTSFEPYDEEEPVLMMMDHPFQFIIYDEDEDLVLFEGRLGEPEILDGVESAPSSFLGDSVHADEDFWQSSFGVEPVNPPIVTAASEPSGSTVGSSLALLVGMSTLALGLVLAV